MDEENLEEENLDLESDPSEYKDSAPDPTQLKAATLINQNLVGVLEEIGNGEATVRLVCTEDMVVDSKGLIHTGFLFSAANYAATAAINQKNGILVVSKSNFLSPVALNDVIVFKAKSMQSESRKRVVEVGGYLQNIKVFEGEFSMVILDRHGLSLHLR